MAKACCPFDMHHASFAIFLSCFKVRDSETGYHTKSSHERLL